MTERQITFFKKYCEFNNLNGKYAFGHIDDNGNGFLELLTGKKSYHVAYKGADIREGILYRIYPATCDSSECSVGKPKPKCLAYSANKCAVYFYDAINLDTFTYGFTQSELQEFLSL